MSIERWEIDGSRSRIHFAVRHLVFSKTNGRFRRWSGTVMVPDGDFRQHSRFMGTRTRTLSAATAVDRRDFGFTGNLALDSGGIVIGARIDVGIEVEAVRQPAVRAA